MGKLVVSEFVSTVIAPGAREAGDSLILTYVRSPMTGGATGIRRGVRVR